MMKRISIAILTALALWTMMFSPLTAPALDLWPVMTVAAVILTCMATAWGRWYRGFRITASDIGLGIASATLLWGIFWTGDKLSQLMFDFARPEVNHIYDFKGDTSPWLLSALLLFVIGPAEEIFWRGYVQRTFSAKWGPVSGFIAATAVYSLVHVGSCNFMLVMAALVAGGFWGLAYRVRPDRLGALVVSHAVWDAAVFVWFPI